MEQNALLARLDRLESIEESRQLAGKYSLSLDMRDLDAHVNLFAEDIRVGREKTGRAHLKAWVDSTLRDQFHGTSHHLGQHLCAQLMLVILKRWPVIFQDSVKLRHLIRLSATCRQELLHR